jgi:Family of unknown function (DUF5681)
MQELPIRSISSRCRMQGGRGRGRRCGSCAWHWPRAGDTAITAVSTGAKQRGVPFKPGVSGNPAGRPKGSRNRHSENFLAAFASDFELHGGAIIEQVRREQPAIYLKIASDRRKRDLSLKASVTRLRMRKRARGRKSARRVPLLAELTGVPLWRRYIPVHCWFPPF